MRERDRKIYLTSFILYLDYAYLYGSGGEGAPEKICVFVCGGSNVKATN